jgi:hypothetical protein
MAINAQIPLGVQPVQFENPVNQLAKVLQIKDMQQGQQMNALRMDEYKRGIEDKAALRSALSAPDADPYKVLLQRGDVKGATDFQKSQADVEKNRIDAERLKVDTAHKRVDSWGQAMGWLRQNPSAQNAQAAVQHLVTLGVMPPQMAQAALQQVQSGDPQAIAQFAEMGFRTALQAKDQLPKIQTNNIGGQTVTQGIDPVTGKASMVSAIQNTQSPDNAASVAATMRGQNMTDARSREATAVQRDGVQAQRDAARMQVLETPNGVVLVDKATGQSRPATMNGQPLPGKPSAATEKELVGIRQQNSIIDGAISAVDQTPSAFTFRRGTATMAGAIPESLAGRMDSDAERQARSYVFNNVSKVINERAGAAQSAQELARLRSFLPAETDNAAQIKSKLQAFKTYLSDMESGTRGAPSKPAAGGGGWGIQRVN